MFCTWKYRQLLIFPLLLTKLKLISMSINAQVTGIASYFIPFSCKLERDFGYVEEEK